MNSALRSTSLSLHGIEDAHYHLGSPVDFTAEGRGAFYTDSCWATPDNYGTWTLGPEASLIMYLGEVPPDKLVSAVFTISDAMVTSNSPVSRWMCCSMMRMSTNGCSAYRETQERKVKVEPEVVKRRQP